MVHHAQAVRRLDPAAQWSSSNGNCGMLHKSRMLNKKSRRPT